MWCVICYLGHVYDASWLFVPEGGSYLDSWYFTYYMVLISPCGLMDISYWLISLVFHVCYVYPSRVLRFSLGLVRTTYRL